MHPSRELSNRVLVVDDDRDMCDVLAADLESRGLAVETEHDPDAALLVLGQRDFDVVITDLRMPGMSGAQLCERVAVNRPDVPVVVVTAFASMDTSPLAALLVAEIRTVFGAPRALPAARLASDGIHRSSSAPC